MGDKWMIWLAIGVVSAGERESQASPFHCNNVADSVHTVFLMCLVILHRDIRALYRRLRGIELQQHKLESTDNSLVRNV
jgi:hypothetical protein